MYRSTLPWVCGVALALAACGCSSDDDGEGSGGTAGGATGSGGEAIGGAEGKTTADGLRFNVRTPPTYDATAASPLLVVYASSTTAAPARSRCSTARAAASTDSGRT